MADPAFMQKLFIEEIVTTVLSLSYEIRQRGENFTKVCPRAGWLSHLGWHP